MIRSHVSLSCIFCCRYFYVDLPVSDMKLYVCDECLVLFNSYKKSLEEKNES